MPGQSDMEEVGWSEQVTLGGDLSDMEEILGSKHEAEGRPAQRPGDWRSVGCEGQKEAECWGKDVRVSRAPWFSHLSDSTPS